MVAVEKASMEAQKTAITVPITKEFSLPHRLDIQVKYKNFSFTFIFLEFHWVSDLLFSGGLPLS